MDNIGTLDSFHPKKRKTNATLGLFIVVMLLGISVGMYLLNTPQIFNPRAASDTFSKCGPPGHCTDYGWNDNNGYTKVTDNCYIALYKCYASDWNQAIAVGCQRNKSDPSRDLAYWAEIHKKTDSPPPNPQLWDKVVAGTDGNGHIKSFPVPQFCGVWQIDVGPPCNKSFHSGGDKRDSTCKAPPQTHNVCEGTACKQVNGPGSNDCTTPGTNPANQCSHKKCENNKCILVAGGNVDNKCTTDSDCLVTPTPTLITTITPTPPSCPVPSPVTNLKIVCPICSGTQ